MHAEGSGPCIGPSFEHAHGNAWADLFKARRQLGNTAVGDSDQPIKAIKNLKFPIESATPRR